MKLVIGETKFFTELSQFASLLLPIVGVAVLLILCKVLWELVHVVKNLDTTVTKVNTTIDKVDHTIDQLDAPLQTVANVSKSVDDVLHFVRHSVVEKSVNMIVDNYSVVKEWAMSLFSKESKATAPVDEVFDETLEV